MKRLTRVTAAATLALSLGLPAAAQTAAPGAKPGPKAPFQTKQEQAEAMAPAPERSVNPFRNSTTPPPPPSVYSGATFQLSYNYPNSPVAPKQPFPWVQALQGKPIGTTINGQNNAIAYTDALKQYITPNMLKLLFDYSNWNAASAGWYNQPWLADIREPIYGMYLGSEFQPFVYPSTGLKVNMQTYVLTFYDPTAAYTLRQVWGSDAMNPNVTNTKITQFAEGSVIVKLAVTTASAKDWPVMDGAATLPIWIPPVDSQKGTPRTLVNASLMQVDIIVKDTKTAPKTGWVFTTLVYDKDYKSPKGSQLTAWDKMIPLGAMWGNDPEARDASVSLKENVINPDAPVYSVQTLGWNGRLSGPNDGSVLTPAYVNGVMIPAGAYSGVAVSSCMSCHGVAEWPMKSFLLPNVTYPPSSYPPGDPNGALMIPEPASNPWMTWFQSRPGTQPQDTGTVAFDYDMVFVFKSLPAWQKATQSQKKDPKMLKLMQVQEQVLKVDKLRRGLGETYTGK